MKILLATILSFLSFSGIGQWKDYQLIHDGKDTINRIDQNGKKQWEWVVKVASIRGEPGYEEEGIFINDRKEGEWRIFNLMGDLIGIEQYKWGLKDGKAMYFNINGQLRMEQSWLALNPDKQFDTIQVEDLDRLNVYRQVVVKNEGASLKHGTWNYFDTERGTIARSENYVLGKLESRSEPVVARPEEPKKVPKPKEVVEFEKQNKGKKVRFQDGSTR